MADRPSLELCESTVAAIADRLALTERPAANGDAGPYLTLTSAMSPDPVGSVRVLEGVCTLVYVGLVVPMIGLDSHMLFAFTPQDSAVPHFTLDSVAGGRGPDGDAPAEFAFHLDMIPRVDPGAHLGYLLHCYEPLTAVREKGLAIEGLSPAMIGPVQWQLMSTWMMANRADLAAFTAIADVVAAYRDHWFDLMESGVPAELLDGTDLAALARRDQANRDAIFNPEVDAVWGRVTQLLGEDQSETVRNLLRTAGREQ